jgi:uncharacterized protein YndB with AHSA1/START domain
MTMTSNKDFKRLVRARMRRTGEAYTAARAQILKKQARTRATTAPTAARASTKPKDYAALAGMSDAAVKAKTGCTWERWVNALDYHRADAMAHRDIAELVSTKFKVGSWWAQTVAVGYERIKGLRTRGQQRDGTYEATKSRTFDVPVATLFSAWADAKRRRRWLNGAATKVRTSAAPKSIRLDWADGEDRAIIAVGFTPKGGGKSAVAVAHDKLPDRETANRIKQYWSERFDALRDVLASEKA